MPPDAVSVIGVVEAVTVFPVWSSMVMIGCFSNAAPDTPATGCRVKTSL